MANAFVTGAVRMTVPESLKIELRGPRPAGITAKDIVLQLLALPAIKSGLGVGKVFEFTGDVVSELSIDERATLTNMTAELGGLTGIVAPDEQRSEEHTSELQSLMRISYAVFCLKKKKHKH